MSDDYVRIYVGTPQSGDDALFVDLIVNGLCIPIPCKCSEISLEEGNTDNILKALEEAFNISKLLTTRLHLKVSISKQDVDSLMEYLADSEKKEVALLLKELTHTIEKGV